MSIGSQRLNAGLFRQICKTLSSQKSIFLENSVFFTKFFMLLECVARFFDACCVNYLCFIRKLACMHRCNMLMFHVFSTRLLKYVRNIVLLFKKIDGFFEKKLDIFFKIGKFSTFCYHFLHFSPKNQSHTCFGSFCKR